MKNTLKLFEIFFWIYTFGAPALYFLLYDKEICGIALCVLAMNWVYIIVCRRGKTNLYTYKPVFRYLKLFLLIAVPLVHLVLGVLIDFGVLSKPWEV